VPIAFARRLPEGGVPHVSINNRRASGAVSAVRAYRNTGDDHWRKEAWSPSLVPGSNDLQFPVRIPPPVAAETVAPGRVNENQGAESTLSFLMAQVEMRLLGEITAHIQV